MVQTPSFMGITPPAVAYLCTRTSGKKDLRHGRVVCRQGSVSMPGGMVDVFPGGELFRVRAIVDVAESTWGARSGAGTGPPILKRW